MCMSSSWREKSNRFSEEEKWIPAAMFLPFQMTPTHWALHLYKFQLNISANNYTHIWDLAKLSILLSFIMLQIIGFFQPRVSILIFYGVAVKTKKMFNQLLSFYVAL